MGSCLCGCLQFKSSLENEISVSVIFNDEFWDIDSKYRLFTNTNHNHSNPIGPIFNK